MTLEDAPACWMPDRSDLELAFIELADDTVVIVSLGMDDL